MASQSAALDGARTLAARALSRAEEGAGFGPDQPARSGPSPDRISSRSCSAGALRRRARIIHVSADLADGEVTVWKCRCEGRQPRLAGAPGPDFSNFGPRNFTSLDGVW